MNGNVSIIGRRAGNQWRGLHCVRDHPLLLGAASYQPGGGFLPGPETQPEPGKATQKKL